jgi:hypothetical protein
MDQALSQLQVVGSACSARNKQQGKQQSKQLLHALVNVSDQQWDRFFEASGSPERAAVKLLAALQPQLQLPHPYDSVTATCMGFQLLERLLNYLASKHAQEQQIHSAAKQKANEQQPVAAIDGPDAQQSRDTNTPADSVLARGLDTEQLQLLCHLHACAGLCWQAIVSKTTDLGLARHILQYHASAQACLVLIQRYCTAAGIAQELQQLLVSLLLHGTVLQLCPAQTACKGDAAAAASATAAADASAPCLILVKKEPDSQATEKDTLQAGSAQTLLHQQQQLTLRSSPQQKQPAVPLLASLKALMRSSKAHNAAARAAQRASNSSGSGTPRGAAASTPGAAAAGASSPGGPLHAAVSTAEVARAEELSVSGIKAWGLIASALGPKLLDKAVGQPMLDVS